MSIGSATYFLQEAVYRLVAAGEGRQDIDAAIGHMHCAANALGYDLVERAPAEIAAPAPLTSAGAAS